MRARYVTVDVFTNRRFAGNPLAVFPDARDIPPAAMPAITREFNLSETVFVLPPVDPAHARRLRIFTPGRELPFAGHPTVGTAWVLAKLGLVSLDRAARRPSCWRRASGRSAWPSRPRAASRWRRS